MTLKTTLNENTKAIEEHKSLEVPRSQKKKECSIVRLCKVNILGHWLFRFFFLTRASWQRGKPAL